MNYRCTPDPTEVLPYVDVNGFDLNAELESLLGAPTLEIAGPTDFGFPIIDNRLTSQPLITNILQHRTDNETVDVLADFKQLPIKSGAIGMVLASCIPLTGVPCSDTVGDARQVRERSINAYTTYAALGGVASKGLIKKNQRIAVMEEAARVLRQDGLLVWQGGHPEDIEIARLNGLKLGRYGKREGYIEYPDGEQVKSESYQCIFQKR